MGFVLDAVGEIKLKKLKSLEGIGLYPSTEAASKAIKEMLPLEASQRKVSDMTAQVAQAAFAKGNVYLSLRDEIVQIYEDRDFIKLYPKKGNLAFIHGA